MTDHVSLTVAGREHRLPIIRGTLGEPAIDLARLRDETGLLAFDPGLGSTAVCTSAITYIDGDQGILRYRGIPIEQFARQPNFIEVAMLLIFGALPDEAQYHRFAERLTRNAHIHEGMRHHFEGFPPESPPMAMLSAMLNVLACYHRELLTLESDDQFEELTARLISKVRTIAAYSFRSNRGLPFIYPDPSLRYCANFYHLLFSQPYKQIVIDDVTEEALNLLFILHADHEQNCSTSTVRVVGSSQSNLFASVASGVSALWGPLHGGANVAVMEMLEAIHKGGMTADACIAKAKDRKDPFRLMGFGHRVYRNYDPRAKMLKAVCDRVFARRRLADPLLDIARRLEEAALSDPFFVERKLYPNVDFYSGILMRALGIPTNMFTVMFAIGRLPGWIAHWREQHLEAKPRIFRPRQIYTGPVQADWMPPEQR